MKKSELKKMLDAIKKNGRPLERARINHLFFNGSFEDVLSELNCFQNSDGGFGHALEPDIWNPNSSPIQTWTAITILQQLEVTSSHTTVKRILSYLELSFDKKSNSWPRLDPTNNSFPHAPWWSYKVEETSFNPSASIAGFVVKHAHESSSVYRYATLVIGDALAYIENTNEDIEMHELRCLFDMINDLQVQRKEDESFDFTKRKLLRHFSNIVENDSSRWFSSYCVKPSAVIRDHPSVGSNEFKALLYKEFKTALENLNSDALWDITWSWDDYPEEFIIASTIWKSIIGFEYLYLMKKFGYLDKKNFV